MPPEPAPPDLWSFSLATYGKPGVAEACLDAQDRFGQDVNLLLWAAWAGWAHGHVLTRAELDAARAAVAHWSAEVVAPLRTLRRRLKTGPSPAPGPDTDAFRNRVKALELEAERLEQAVLACHPATLRRDTGPAAALAANLSLLLPAEAGSVAQALRSALGAAP